MTRLFGTDGVRGLANAELTPEFVLRLTSAAADVLPAAPAARGRPTAPAAGGRPTAVVGYDPRASSEMLEAAVCAGLTAAGVDAIRVGVLPTPAVAYLTADYGAAFGVMISASHNPMPDNGIKFFGPGGHKLADAVEDRIEAALGADRARPVGADVGRIHVATDAADRYLRHLAGAVDHRLDGLRVVVDCANGASSAIGPQVYAAAGASVIGLHSDPDGLNINDGCGSTHLDALQAAVLEHGADLGIAHDGDADRCLAVDAAGQIVDGDAIMAVLAIAMRDRGRLHDDVLVATVMSNLGLHLAMREVGISVATTSVGDRYVLSELRRGGYSLGGEQSGHIVVPAVGTTGDGILTALLLMEQMAATGRGLADLASVMTQLPQVLINVPVADKHAVADDSGVTDAVAAAERALGETGRVLLRPSGTEQLVRVMVEAPTADGARKTAEQIAGVVGGVPK